MRRYELGTHDLIDKLISEYNNNEDNKVILSCSGLLINENYEFSSVVEYYELEPVETFDITEKAEELMGSVVLAGSLQIPLYIITYKKNDEYFKIFDYFKNIWFTKSIKVVNFKCEFIEWWKTLKGTVQIKPFYKDNEQSYFINELLIKNGLRWGGDIDGFVYDYNDKQIQSILEFRKSTKINIKVYDPGKYYRGYYNRAGDYNTWRPLVKLKKHLNVPLFLITLSELDEGVYGGTEIVDATPNDLLYEDNVVPNLNLTTSINLLIDRLYMESDEDE